MRSRRRLFLPGALYYVLSRAAEGRRIVRSDVDAQDLLKRIEAATRASSVKVYAWALTKQALRILLRAGQYPLSIFVRRVLSGHALKRLYRQREEGPLVSGRYRCVLVEERGYFLSVVRDIHASAFYEGEVSSLDQLCSYGWHGHCNLTGESSCDWQDTSYVLRKFSPNAAEARGMYKKFVLEAPAPEHRPMLQDRSCSASGWKDPRVLGSREFTASALRRFEDSIENGSDLHVRKTETLREVMVRVGEHTGVRISEIKGRSKRRVVSSARALVCYAGVFQLGMTYREVSEVLGITPSAVYMACGRGRKMVAASADLREVVSVPELCVF